MALSNLKNAEAEVKARLELKTNAFLKNQLEHAAALSGLTLTAFVLAAAADKATKVIHETETMRITNEAFDKLMAHINRKDKSGPTEAMKAFSKRECKYEIHSNTN